MSTSGILTQGMGSIAGIVTLGYLGGEIIGIFNIALGSAVPMRIYLGANLVSKAYLGTTEVFST